MYYIVDKYNSKLSFDKKDNLIKKYNLKYIDQFKKYIIQNIEIVSNKNSTGFEVFDMHFQPLLLFLLVL